MRYGKSFNQIIEIYAQLKVGKRVALVTETNNISQFVDMFRKVTNCNVIATEDAEHKGLYSLTLDVELEPFDILADIYIDSALIKLDKLMLN